MKILDFGVSKFSAHGDDMAATGGGLVLGTPFYMSPEQAKGARHIDHRSDLYAVGVILYECVTGKVPFEAETLNELIFRIVLEAPPPVESLVPDLDPGFVAILHKAMAREAGQRFQTAREMHDALAHWLAPDRAHVGLDTSSALLWAAAPLRHRARKSERAFILGLLATLALGGATLFAVRPHGADLSLAPPARPAAGVPAETAAPIATASSTTAPPKIRSPPASADPPSIDDGGGPHTPASAIAAAPTAKATTGRGPRTGTGRPANAPRHPAAPAVVVPAGRTVPDEL